jgi:hypothetical protein
MLLDDLSPACSAALERVADDLRELYLPPPAEGKLRR